MKHFDHILKKKLFSRGVRYYGMILLYFCVRSSHFSPLVDFFSLFNHLLVICEHVFGLSNTLYLCSSLYDSCQCHVFSLEKLHIAGRQNKWKGIYNSITKLDVHVWKCALSMDDLEVVPARMRRSVLSSSSLSTSSSPSSSSPSTSSPLWLGAARMRRVRPLNWRSPPIEHRRWATFAKFHLLLHTQQV